VKSNSPTLRHVVPSRGGRPASGICAVTSFDDDVFVVRYNSELIEVYSAVTFLLQRHLRIPELRPNPYGLVACTYNNCLYASVFDDNRLRRVDLTGGSVVKKWTVASGPAGLSVNGARNVVVTCCEARKLHEYTTLGTLVREISLQAGVMSPWHAVQLSTGDYVVSQNTSPGAVSVVGANGQVAHSYESSQTSCIGPMLFPSNLSLARSGHILVADVDNNRILSVNSSLDSARNLALSVDGGIQEPCSFCLDESRDQLYVGEFGGLYRLLIFDGVSL